MKVSLMLFRIFLFGFLALIFPACGIKKSPEPPEKLFPLKVKDYQVRVQDGCVNLSWSYPGTEPPAKFRIQKIEQGIEANSSGSIQSVEISGKENFFQDCAISDGFLYGYQVIGVSQAKFSGEPSKIIWVKVPQLPLAPEKLQAFPGDRFIDFSWETAPELAYNLYRTKTPGQFPEKPINPSVIKEGRYSDLGLENGTEYYYCLRAVVLQKEYPALESKCALISATPIDLIAPSVPRGLVVVLSGKQVVLKWFKNPEPDLLGYLVYRRRPGSVWTRLTKEPILEPEYQDSEAFHLKGTFEYAVSAVDNAENRNQSALSLPERISIP